jgi:hypothetical protein
MNRRTVTRVRVPGPFSSFREKLRNATAYNLNIGFSTVKYGSLSQRGGQIAGCATPLLCG